MRESVFTTAYIERTIANMEECPLDEWGGLRRFAGFLTDDNEDAAVSALVALTERRPDIWQAWRTLLGLYQQSGRDAEALALCRKRIESAPQDITGHWLACQYYSWQKQLAEEMEALHLAVECGQKATVAEIARSYSPSSPFRSVIFQYGHSNDGQVMDQAMLAIAENESSLRPGDADLAFRYGVLAISAGTRKRGLEKIRDFLRFRPGHLGALFFQAQYTSDYAPVVAACQEYLRANPGDPATMLRLSQALINLGEKEAAFPILEEICTRFAAPPQATSSLSSLGPKGANAARRIAADHIRLLRDRCSNAAAKKSDYRALAQIWNRYSDIDPDTFQEFLSEAIDVLNGDKNILLMAATHHQNRQNWSQWGILTERLITIMPFDFSRYSNIREVLQNRDVAALQDWKARFLGSAETALRLPHLCPREFKNIVQLLINLGHPQKAEAACEQAASRWPDDVSVKLALADACAKNGNAARASEIRDICADIVVQNLSIATSSTALEVARSIGNSGSREIALHLCEDIAHSFPDSLEICEQLAQICQQQEDTAAAQKHRRRQAEIMSQQRMADPAIGPQGAALVSAWVAAGDVDAALREAEAIADRDPNNLQAFLPIFTALAAANDKGRIQSIWARFVPLLSKLTDATYGSVIQVGHQLRNMGCLDEAGQVFTELAHFRPDDANIHVQLAGISQRQEDSAAARRHHRRNAEILSQNRKNDPASWREQGANIVSAWINAGETENALREAEDILELHPEEPQAYGPMFTALASVKDKRRIQLIWTRFAPLLSKLTEETFVPVTKIGHQLRSMGCLDEAERVFSDLSCIKPDDPNIHTELGWICRLRGSTPASRQHFRRQAEILSQRQKDDPALWRSHGRSLISAWIVAGDQNRALDEAETILRQNPQEPEAHTLVFRALEATKDKSRVQPVWMTFSALLDGITDATYSQITQAGHHLQNIGCFDETQTVFQRLTEFKPDDHNAHAILANTYKQQGDIPAARRHFRRQAEILSRLREGNPTIWRTQRTTVAQAWIAAGETDTAIRQATQIVEMNPDDLLAYEAMIASLAANNDKAGIRLIWKQFVRLLPTLSDATYDAIGRVGQQLDGSAHLTEARQIFSALLKFRPDDTNVLTQLAEICRKQGDIDGARQHHHRRAEILSQYRDGNPGFLHSHGAAFVSTLIAAGETEEALHQAEQMVALNPAEALPYQVLLSVLEVMGDAVRLQATLTKLGELMPENEVIQLRLAQFHLERGDQRHAEKFAMRGADAIADSKRKHIKAAEFRPRNEAEARLAELSMEFDGDTTLMEEIYRAQRRIGDDSGAMNTVQRLVRTWRQRVDHFPDDSHAWSQLGHFVGILGQTDQEIEYCRTALDKDPRNTNAALFLSHRYFYTGQPVEAILAIDTLAKNLPQARFMSGIAGIFCDSLNLLSRSRGAYYFTAASYCVSKANISLSSHNDLFRIAALHMDVFDQYGDSRSRTQIETHVAESHELPVFHMIEQDTVLNRIREWIEYYKHETVSPVADIIVAVNLLKDAVGMTASESVSRPRYLSSLARALFKLARVSLDGAVLNEALAYCRDMADRGEEGYLREVMIDALDTADGLFRAEHWAEAVEAYRFLDNLGERLRNLSPSRAPKEEWLKVAQRMAPHAAYACWRHGDNGQAVVALERGLATLMRDELMLRNTDMVGLRQAARHHLSEGEFTQLCRAADDFDAAANGWERLWGDKLADQKRWGFGEVSSIVSTEDLCRARDSLDQALDAIRSVAGFENFLVSVGIREIKAAAEEVPLLYLVYTPKGGLALLVTDVVSVIELPSLNSRDVERKTTHYLFHYRRYRDASLKAERDPSPMIQAECSRAQVAWLTELDKVLAWLWPAAMGPIVAHLKKKRIGKAVLVGGGLLRSLPLGAAYTSPWWSRLLFFLKHGAEPPPLASPKRRYALDEVCFSTAPSAYSLLAAKKAGDRRGQGEDCLLIFRWMGAGWRGFEQEAKAARLYCPQGPEIAAPDPRCADPKAQLLEALRSGQVSVVQHSGHGRTDFDDPLNKAGLLVGGDGEAPELLTMREIMELDLSLRAYVLSACESALEGKRDIAHEAVGLPAALLQAGAAAVVAPAWTVSNSATAHLISRFHELWRTKFPDDPTEALRQAQIWVRDNLRRGEVAGDAVNSPYARRAPGTPPSAAAPEPPSADIGPNGEPLLRLGPFDAVPPDHPFFWAGFTCTGG